MRLDAEKDTVVAAKYNVRSFPTIMVLRPDGTEIDRVVGYYRAPEFIGLVEDYLAGRNTLGSLLNDEAYHLDDPPYISKLADRLYEHGRFADAQERYHRLMTVDPKNTSDLVDDALYRLSRMSRKERDYKAARAYAQRIIDDYPKSDYMRYGWLEVGINWKREGELGRARRTFLDYVKRFPDDEDAPWAQEQADTLAAQIAHGAGA